VAVYVEGQDAAAVRERIVADLPPRLRVVDAEELKQALRAAGQRGEIGVAIAQPGKVRDRALEKVRNAAAAAHADRLVVGRTRRVKGARDVYLVLVDPALGLYEVDEAVPLEGGSFAPVLGPALERLLPVEIAPAPTAQPAEDPARDAADDDNDNDASEPGAGRESGDPGRAILGASATFAVGGRWFSYNDALTKNLRTYDVFGAPIAMFGLEVYPLATREVSVVSGLGITGSYAQAFGLESAIEGGGPISTTWRSFDVGLRLRLRAGDGDGAPIVGLRAGYGALAFSFDEPPAWLGDEVPSVDYGFLRGGADARLPLGRAAILLSAGYRGVLSAGEVGDRFRAGTVGAVDAGAGLAVALAAGFELRLLADYTRFFYAFEPEPGDAYVAGGALDQLLTVGLGAGFYY
jgi:hypothetical protein